MRSVAAYLPLLAVGLSAVICLQLTRHITSPLFELRRSAEALARGTLTTRVPGRVSERQDEIGQLGRDFDRMAERVESLVEGHKRLLGDVSHELRSPLSRLVVALGLARRAHADEMPGLLDRVAVEARRLDDLISQLLTLSRIENGTQLSDAAIDVASLIEGVVADADFEARADSRRVILAIADECTAMGSEDLLRSAIENVVRNAVRFTRADTTVDVTLRREGERAVIRVRDWGPGVPDARLEEIFLPFRRVPPSDVTRSAGSGLGLAIAHRAVSASGGTIAARNVTGGGLLVEIVIPLLLDRR